MSWSHFVQEPLPKPWQVQSLPGTLAVRVQHSSAAHHRRVSAALGAGAGHEHAAEVPQTDAAPRLQQAAQVSYIILRLCWSRSILGRRVVVSRLARG